MLVRRKEEPRRCPSGRNQEERLALLKAVILEFAADQGVEDGKNMAAVFKHARENVAKLGLTLCVAMPPGENGGWNFNVLTQFFRGMPAQEQTVEKCRFPLRILQIHSDFGRQVSSHRRHWKTQFTEKRFRVK